MQYILLTKLYIPNSSSAIHRGVLLGRLDSVLEKNNPLTLISVPVGYGKTTDL